MKKIKRITGEIIEVEDGYDLSEGETLVEEIKPVEGDAEDEESSEEVSEEEENEE